MRLYKILKKPIVTEKIANMGIWKFPKYWFEVSSDATKIDIKKSILELYWVEVGQVNIVSTREKFKYGRKRWMQIRKREEKKAYVTLKDSKSTLDPTIIV